MGDKTAITWTDATWNPVTGCTPVSEGCRNCYAARYAKRGIGDFGPRHIADIYETVNRHFSQVRTHPERLEMPMRWKKPRMIFVCSMGDLFHDRVPFEFIARVFGHMHSAKWHTFQVLTKRADRMKEFIDWYRWTWMLVGDHDAYPREYQHVMLGVTAENQAAANERIPYLLRTPAAVRFVSCEPLLGPIDLTDIVAEKTEQSEHHIDALVCDDHPEDCGDIGQETIDWVIVGGESGPGARPCHPDWVRSIRDQCMSANVPMHFKQWGEWREPLDGEDFNTSHGIGGKPPAFIVSGDGSVHCFHSEYTKGGRAMIRVGKHKAGRVLDGREWLEFPGNAQEIRR